jgi:hypothetical protein
MTRDMIRAATSTPVSGVRDDRIASTYMSTSSAFMVEITWSAKKPESGVKIKAMWDMGCLPVSVKSNLEVRAKQVRFFMRHRWQLVMGGAPD